jgi:hypothetical protein
VLLRPDAAELVAADAPLRAGRFRLQGELRACSFRGRTWQAEVVARGVALRFELPAAGQVCAAGQPVTLEIDPVQALQWYPGAVSPESADLA